MTAWRRWAILLVVALLAGALPVVALPGAAQASKDKPLRVPTLPTVAGFPVTLDGRTVLTDARGTATFPPTNRRSLASRIGLKDKYTTLGGAPAHVVASRLYVRSGHPTVVLDVFWQVRFSYLDVKGGAVDESQIEWVRLKSSTGQVLKIPAKDPVWLQGSRVVPLSGGLENKKIYWTVQEVSYAGANVVNSSQQRFLPADEQRVGLKLLFYQTTVKSRDAFFGFGTGSHVQLTYPDLSSGEFRLGAGHSTELPSLPRGNYVLSVTGPGPAMHRPLAVSRDQDLDLDFYSWVDIAFAGLLLGIFALGTLLIGWRRRVRHRVATAAPTGPAEPASTEPAAAEAAEPAPAEPAAAESTPAEPAPDQSSGEQEPATDGVLPVRGNGDGSADGAKVPALAGVVPRTATDADAEAAEPAAEGGEAARWSWWPLGEGPQTMARSWSGKVRTLLQPSGSDGKSWSWWPDSKQDGRSSEPPAPQGEGG